MPDSLVCGRVSHVVGWSELRSQNRPFCLTTAFVKCQKMAILCPFLKFCFAKNLDLRLIFCTVQIKDSCIVDIENRRFYLLFLSLIWDFAREWLQQKMFFLVLMHFIVDLTQKWLREETFYYPLLRFIVDFARAALLWKQIFDFIFLFKFYIVYARTRVTCI